MNREELSHLLRAAAKIADDPDILVLGQRLSAFNLEIETDVGKISIESAFQGSKVFEQGGPYTDIYGKDSYGAKKDERLRESGQLIGFNYFGQDWPLIARLEHVLYWYRC